MNYIRKFITVNILGKFYQFVSYCWNVKSFWLKEGLTAERRLNVYLVPIYMTKQILRAQFHDI